MTAKEIKEKARLRNCLQLHEQTKSATMDNNYYFIDKFSFKESEFKAFCEALCREQREECAIYTCGDSPSLIDNREFATRELILNAPMPEL